MIHEHIIKKAIRYAKEKFNIDEKALIDDTKKATIQLRDSYNNYESDKQFYIEQWKNYVVDLIGWNSTSQYNGLMRIIETGITDATKRRKTFLDYGGGMGIPSMLAAELGMDVYYVDFMEGIGQYAQQAFKDLGYSKIKCLDVSEFHSLKEIDVICALDVIEHVDNPFKLISDFKKLKPELIMAYAVWYTSKGMHPMHYEYKCDFKTLMISFEYWPIHELLYVPIPKNKEIECKLVNI